MAPFHSMESCGHEIMGYLAFRAGVSEVYPIPFQTHIQLAIVTMQSITPPDLFIL